MIPSEALVDEPERNGVWVADITTTEEPNGSFELGERTWVGALTPLGAVADGAQWHARIVGGRGKLGATVPFKNYAASIGAAEIARDILRDCGETAGLVDFGGLRVGLYERIEGTAARALTTLCEQTGFAWWVTRDGAVTIGKTRAALAVSGDKTPTLKTNAQGALLSITRADDLHPGMTIDGRPVRGIRWAMRSKLSADCHFENAELPDEDQRLNYAFKYKAKVSKQNANGTIDCIVDGRFKIAQCELLSGLPGTKVTVEPGESVAVGWFGGRPTQPYAWSFAQALDAAARMALVGDGTESILPPFAFQGVVGVPPAATPITGVMTALIPRLLGSVIGPGSGRTQSQ